MNFKMTYRGVPTTVSQCSRTGMFFGEVGGAHGSHAFQAESLIAVTAAFRETVDCCLPRALPEVRAQA